MPTESTEKSGHIVEVSPSVMAAFLNLFCKHRDPNRYITKTATSWSTVKEPWRPALVLQHLKQKITIGLHPGAYYDLLIFDLDCKNPASKKTLLDRCRSILLCFDTMPLIYTSSASGGLRMCYFLDKSYPREQIKAFAEQQLRARSVQVGSGYIEIMADGKGDRLPFGAGSFLVDPATLRVRREVDLAGMIAHAQECRDAKRLSLPSIKSKRAKPGESAYLITVKSLLEHGLTKKITTTDSLMKLNYYFRVIKGLGAVETKAKLKELIKSRHNGHSTRINSGKSKSLFAQIDRIVDGFSFDKVKYRPNSEFGVDSNLRREDVRQILARFSSYRDQRAAFSLLKHAKRYGSLENSECRNSTPIVTLNNKQGNLIRVPFLQSLLCEIPYKTFRSFDGFNKRSPKKTIDRLVNCGLLEVYSEFSYAKHECRTYRVHFLFAPESPEVESLNAALRESKSPEELISDYGRYRAAKIRRKE